jgi:hypothetical protein
MNNGWGIGAGLLRKRKNAPVRQGVGRYIPKVIYLDDSPHKNIRVLGCPIIGKNKT